MGSPSIIVTGAGGVLGRAAVRAFADAGVAAHGLGRSAPPYDFVGEWTKADLLRIEGLRSALTGFDIVIHAASDLFRPDADVAAAANLALAASEAGCRRIVFVQIAGIAKAKPVSAYYRAKALAEDTLRRGAVPVTVITGTQFHDLIDRVFTALSRGPFFLRPRFKLQPLDVGFFVDEISRRILAGDLADITIRGPEMLTSQQMAADWLQAHRRRRALVLPMPPVGVLAGLAQIEKVEGLSGGASWAQWLSRRA